MNKKVTKLAGWISSVLALGLIVFLLLDRDWREGRESDGKSNPVTKRFQRNHDRTDGRAVGRKNPREEFETARKQGLTEEEVRWIVKDFVATGLVGMEIDTNSEEELLKMRGRVMDWYLSILDEGFGWTEEQKIEAREKLLETAESDNVRYFLLVEISITWIVSLGAPSQQDATDEVTEAAIDFVGKTIVPGKLCDLDEAQKGIAGFHDENGKWVAMNDGSLTLDYGTDDKYLIEDPSSYCGILIPAGRFFPLSMQQVDSIRSSNQTLVSPDITITGTGSSLKIAKFLTAPQLKTLLLFEPGMAKQLLEKLENPTKKPTKSGDGFPHRSSLSD